MADVKDILGMPRMLGDERPAPKPKQERMKRPEGMSREAFALLDGSHPIAPTIDLGKKKKELKGLKDKRKEVSAKGKALWLWVPFTPAARSGSGLVLRHWAKHYKDASGRPKIDEDDYPFNKFNKKVRVMHYDDEEWEELLVRDPSWSRAETDYLLSECQHFNLKFHVIHDRWQFPGGRPRTLEDIKARYYAVARQLLVGREGGEDGVANHVLVKHPYNAVHERDRKRAVELMMRRTPQQLAEESKIMEQARQIEAVRKAENAAWQAANAQAGPAAAAQQDGVPASLTEPVAPTDIPEQPEEGQSSLFGPSVQPTWPDKPGVYLRRTHTDATAQEQMNQVTGGPRAQKLVDATMAELGITGMPDVATRATCGAYLALRAEVIALQELKKKVQNRQADGMSRGKRGGSKAPRYDDGEASDAPVAKRQRPTKKYVDD